MTDFCFPFTSPPPVSWHTGGRFFGATRDKGKRKHAGCDIIKPVGEIIHAVADGILVHEEHDFYMNTNYVTYQHGPFLIRYGEIKKRSNGHKIPHQVKMGQPIARVGQLIDKKGKPRGHMLHFEMYSKGNLHTTLRGDHYPYYRRSDVIDPAPYLDQWVKRLAPG